MEMEEVFLIECDVCHDELFSDECFVYGEYTKDGEKIYICHDCWNEFD